MKLIAKTIPQPDGSAVYDVYMTFKEKSRLMTTWLATFRHSQDCEDFLTLQAEK